MNEGVENRHNRILSERIKSARNKAKLTQEDLAIRLKLKNPSAVGQWEAARRLPPPSGWFRSPTHWMFPWIGCSVGFKTRDVPICRSRQ